MNNIFYGISAIVNTDISNALKGFSATTVGLLNAIIGGLMIIVGAAIIAICIYYVIKFAHPNVEMAAEAKKRFKAVLISLVLCLLLLSAGMATVKLVLTKIGDAPFIVTGTLLSI